MILTQQFVSGFEKTKAALNSITKLENSFDIVADKVSSVIYTKYMAEKAEKAAKEKMEKEIRARKLAEARKMAEIKRQKDRLKAIEMEERKKAPTRVLIPFSKELMNSQALALRAAASILASICSSPVNPLQMGISR